MKRFAAALLLPPCLMACLTACQSPRTTSLPVALQQQAAQTQAQQQDRFLCVVEPREDNATNLKVMNLQNHLIRSVYLPGRVMSMDGDQEAGKLYLSVRSGDQAPRYDLYELNVAQLTLARPASFSQAGIQPVDFEMLGRQVFVSGQQQGHGSLLMHNLDQGGWKQIVSNFPAGHLEWSKTPHQVQSIFFDEERIIRSTIDVQQQRIVATQSFEHGIPFGNNIGLAAPSGDFFYALHQLQGLVELYAFDVQNASVSMDVTTDKAVGILYSSAISEDGRFLYATIDNRVERYQLQGTQMKRLPPITLKAKEARHLSLSSDQRTLYVSHDGSTSISRIRLNPDLSYQVDELSMPGDNTDLIVF